MTDIQLSPLDEAMNVIIDNRRLQLSEAACDPLSISQPRLIYSTLTKLVCCIEKWPKWVICHVAVFGDACMADPQDIGIETFSTDTLERYPAI